MCSKSALGKCLHAHPVGGRFNLYRIKLLQSCLLLPCSDLQQPQGASAPFHTWSGTRELQGGIGSSGQGSPWSGMGSHSRVGIFKPGHGQTQLDRGLQGWAGRHNWEGVSKWGDEQAQTGRGCSSGNLWQVQHGCPSSPSSGRQGTMYATHPWVTSSPTPCSWAPRLLPADPRPTALCQNYMHSGQLPLKKLYFLQTQHIASCPPPQQHPPMNPNAHHQYNTLFPDNAYEVWEGGDQWPGGALGVEPGDYRPALQPLVVPLWVQRLRQH